jgi:hypothetical protein
VSAPGHVKLRVKLRGGFVADHPAEPGGERERHEEEAGECSEGGSPQARRDRRQEQGAAECRRDGDEPGRPLVVPEDGEGEGGEEREERRVAQVALRRRGRRDCVSPRAVPVREAEPVAHVVAGELRDDRVVHLVPGVEGGGDAAAEEEDGHGEDGGADEVGERRRGRASPRARRGRGDGGGVDRRHHGVSFLSSR